MDGILISGGHDVDSRRYRERAKGYCSALMPERDEQDIAIVQYILGET